MARIGSGPERFLDGLAPGPGPAVAQFHDHCKLAPLARRCWLVSSQLIPRTPQYGVVYNRSTASLVIAFFSLSSDLIGYDSFQTWPSSSHFRLVIHNSTYMLCVVLVFYVRDHRIESTGCVSCWWCVCVCVFATTIVPVFGILHKLYFKPYKALFKFNTVTRWYKDTKCQTT